MSPDSKKQWVGILKILAVVLVVSLGIWGCARKPAEQASHERVRTLEGRCVKLEQDYRTVAQARDRARKELGALEEETTRLQRDVADRAALIKERDELRRQLSTKTTERDNLVTRYEKLRKSLQAIVNDETPQTPAGVPTSAEPVLNGNS